MLQTTQPLASDEQAAPTPRLRLMRLRFGLEVTGEARLPPYKGDLLRTALLWRLGAIWCRQGERCRDGCRSPEECLFGRLLEPAMNPTWSEPVRRLIGSTPPPAYLLWDEQDRRREVKAGDPFHFELALIGEAAMAQLPAFVAAVMIAAERGMGQQRLPARLRRAELVAGGGGEAQPLFIDGAWQGDPLPGMTLDYAGGLAWAGQVDPGRPVTRLRLSFKSPVKVVLHGKVVGEPHFPSLARAVVRRLRILSEVHGGGEWPQAGYGPLLDLADGVRLEHHETAWVSALRHSQQGGTMPLEGFVGQAWYASSADLRPLLPALWLGQWLHVGKGTVWGNGRLTVDVDS